jgi:hypothetical protein
MEDVGHVLEVRGVGGQQVGVLLLKVTSNDLLEMKGSKEQGRGVGGTVSDQGLSE